MRVVARNYATSSWIELQLRGGRIDAIGLAAGAELDDPGDLWVAPAFWDIQVNGYRGHSFSSPVHHG